VVLHPPHFVPFDPAWVELPANAVFDGVVQTFFVQSSYYAVVARHPNEKTTRKVVVDDVTRPAWTGEQDTLALPDWHVFPSQTILFRIRYGSRRAWL